MTFEQSYLKFEEFEFPIIFYQNIKNHGKSAIFDILMRLHQVLRKFKAFDIFPVWLKSFFSSHLQQLLFNKNYSLRGSWKLYIPL